MEVKSNRAVVFGSTGFIGSHLTKRLSQCGYHVLAVGRNPTKLKSVFSEFDKVNIVACDFANIEKNVQLIQENDVIFDLVTSSTPASSVKQPLAEIKHHIYSHTNFFELAVQKKPARIIFPSSGGSIYGDMIDSPFQETDLPDPKSPHAISKLALEYYLDYFCSKQHIPFTIFRISNPFGSGQKSRNGFGLIPTLLDCIETNQPPTLYNKGESIRDFIHISDLISAIITSLSKQPKHSLYNLGSGQGLSISEVWTELRTAAKSDLKVIEKPARKFEVKKVILDISRFTHEFDWQPPQSIRRKIRNLIEE